MRKEDIEKKIYQDTGVAHHEIEEIINSCFQHIMEAVADGEKVVLKGFGIFEPVTKKSRPVRNPRTGEPMVLPKHVAPKFRPGKNFENLVYKVLDE